MGQSSATAEGKASEKASKMKGLQARRRGKAGHQALASGTLVSLISAAWHYKVKKLHSSCQQRSTSEAILLLWSHYLLEWSRAWLLQWWRLAVYCRAGRKPALASPVNRALLDVQAAKLLQQELDAQPVGNGTETAWAWEAPEQGDLPSSTWD